MVHHHLWRLTALLLAVLLSGCGRFIQVAGDAILTPHATAETAHKANTVTWPMESGDYALTRGELIEWQSMQTPETATAETAASLSTLLDDFCAEQPVSFSLYLQNLATGERYTYNEDALYYPASLLKAPYALWLCQRADAGEIDLSVELRNTRKGKLADTALSAYNNADTIPVMAAIHAMVVYSDNKALTILTGKWSAGEGSGFSEYLQTELGFSAADTCSITPKSGILGMASAADFGAVMQALYDYFETKTAVSAFLQSCFLAAGHDMIYVPDTVLAAKKYGSWDYAYHDAVIVYARVPYLIVCMTDQGSADVDFPPETTAAMQTLGEMVYFYWNP